MLPAIRNSLFSIIYPHECDVCAGPVESTTLGTSCHKCWVETRIFDGSEMLCGRCGSFLGERSAPIPVFCQKCDHYRFESAAAIGIYEKALAAAILELKRTPHLDRHLYGLIKNAVDARIAPLNIDLIIPVPLSKRRWIERGFNQAEIIAKKVSKILGTKMDRGSLARDRHTQMHRAGMDQKAREMSVEKAFSVVRPNLIEGRSILLVDDVLTSGATTSACARALKNGGSREVYVFTLARAVVS